MIFFHTYIPFSQNLKVPSQKIGFRAGKNRNFGQEMIFYTVLSINFGQFHVKIQETVIF